MRKDKKQMILQLLNEKIMPSYADKLAYFPSVGLPIPNRFTPTLPTLWRFYPNAGRVLSQLWRSLSQLWEGFITTLALGGFYPNSGRALSQLWGRFYPNSGRVFITTLGGFYPNSGRALSQLWDDFIPTLSQLWEGFITTLRSFFQPKVCFLKHRDAICGAQGCDFLSMGLLIFEHRDAHLWSIGRLFFEHFSMGMPFLSMWMLSLEHRGAIFF